MYENVAMNSISPIGWPLIVLVGADPEHLRVSMAIGERIAYGQRNGPRIGKIEEFKGQIAFISALTSTVGL